MSEQIFKIVVLIVFMVIGGQLSIAMHELGHLVFGLATGYTFQSFTIFNMTIKKENGKLKVRKSILPSNAGGQCLMTPPPYNNGFPYKLYNYGGVIFNLLAVIVFFILSKFLVNHPFIDDVVFIFLWLMNFVLFLSNGIPLVIGGIPNDGKNVQLASQSKEAEYGFYLMLKMEEDLNHGKRVGELPYETFQLSDEADLSQVFVGYVESLRAQWLLENNKIEAGLDVLKQLLPYTEKYPKHYKNVNTLEACFFHLLYNEDKTVGEKLYSKEVNNYFKSIKMIHQKKTQAAYQWFIKGNKERALEIISTYRKELEQRNVLSEKINENYWLDQLEEKIHREEN